MYETKWAEINEMNEMSEMNETDEMNGMNENVLIFILGGVAGISEPGECSVITQRRVNGRECERM